MNLGTVVVLLSGVVIGFCLASIDVGNAHSLPNFNEAVDFSAFESWLHSLSPVNSKIKIQRQDNINGLFLKTDTLKQGETVIEVPLKFCITEETLRVRPYAQYLFPSNVGNHQAQRLLSQANTVMVLGLVTEYLLGDASPLVHWMRILPHPDRNDLTSPIFWPVGEQALIEPRETYANIRRRERDLQAEYETLLLNTGVLHDLQAYILANSKNMPLLELHSAAASRKNSGRGPKSVDSPDDHIIVSLSLYAWAQVLLDTRAWNMEGSKYFVPGADMFNHHPDDHDRSFDFERRPLRPIRSQKFLTYHKIDRRAKVARVLSDRGVRRDEQIFESYGDNSDSIYFEYHGFVPGTPEKFASGSPQLWKNERVMRNRWDCHPIQLTYPSSWNPTLSDLEKNQIPVVRSAKHKKSKKDRERKSKDDSARGEYIRKRFQGFGFSQAHQIPSVCTYYGEVHPMLKFHFLVTVLPPGLLRLGCAQAVKADVSKVYAHDAWKSAYDTLLRCLSEESAEVKKSKFGVGPYVIGGLRMFRLAVHEQFREQFNNSDTGALVTDIERLVHDLSTPPGDSKNEEEEEDGRERPSLLSVGTKEDAVKLQNAIRLGRMRFSLERKMILKELLRRLKKLIDEEVQKVFPSQSSKEGEL